MAKFKAGDKVRVKDRKDWPAPPGYKMADSEGTVVKMAEWQEVMEQFQEFVKVQIEKTKADVRPGTQVLFREESLEKI